MIKASRAVSLFLLVSMAALAASATAPKDPKSREPRATTAAKASADDRSGEKRPTTRKTPFGAAKSTNSTSRPAGPSAAAVRHLVKVEERGDTIVFRQRTPFGERVWKRARTELSAQEREFLETHQAGKPGPVAGRTPSDSGRSGDDPPEKAQ